jgi:non-ribosomal peptide synthetase-like protein
MRRLLQHAALMVLISAACLAAFATDDLPGVGPQEVLPLVDSVVTEGDEMSSQAELVQAFASSPPVAKAWAKDLVGRLPRAKAKHSRSELKGEFQKLDALTEQEDQDDMFNREFEKLDAMAKRDEELPSIKQNTKRSRHSSLKVQKRKKRRSNRRAISANKATPKLQAVSRIAVVPAKAAHTIPEIPMKTAKDPLLTNTLLFLLISMGMLGAGAGLVWYRKKEQDALKAETLPTKVTDQLINYKEDYGAIKPLLPQQANNPETHSQSTPAEVQAEYEKMIAHATRADHIFSATAHRVPSRPAIITRDGTFTYSEVEEMANQIAQELILRRVQGCVGIYMPKASTLFYPTVLGIMKAGCCYLGLDTTFPADRLAFSLKDAESRLVITDEASSHAAAKAAPHGMMVVRMTTDKSLDCVMQGESVLAELPDISQACTGARGNTRMCGATGPSEVQKQLRGMAYILYTSGSTGRPKGVLISQKNLVNYILEGLCKSPGYKDLTENDRVLQQASFAFDMSVEELWWPWSRGAALVPSTRAEMADGNLIFNMLKKFEIDAITVAPAMLSMMPKEAAANLPRLRIVLAGAEAIPPVVVNTWAPGRAFYNSYGPTECTVACIIGRCYPGGSVPLGKAMAGFSVHILRPDMTPVDPHEEGEAYIGGPSVGCGYLSLPEKTAQHFVEHNGERLYKTGDAMIADENGVMFYRGRMDSQVKLRGFRIELEEIENHIMAHVDNAVCAVQECKETEDKLLVAFVVDLQPQDIAPIQGTLCEKTPAYMWPSYFISVSDIPLTVAGKIDRKNLPHFQSDDEDRILQCFAAGSPSEKSSDSEKGSDSSTVSDVDSTSEPESDVPELTHEERIIASVIESVTEQHVSLDDNLTLAGVTSKNMAQISAALRQELNMPDLATSLLIAHPTVRDLAKAVLHLQRTSEADRLGTDPVLFATLPSDMIDPAMRHGNWSYCFSPKFLYSERPILVSALQYSTYMMGMVWALANVALLSWGGFQMMELMNILPADLSTMELRLGWLQFLWTRFLAVPTGDMIMTVVVLGAVLPLLFPLFLAIALLEAILVKKLCIGKIQPEDIPLHSVAYYRWWLNKGICSVAALAGPGPLLPFVLNCMGANVAYDVAIFGEIEAGCAELLEIGEGAYISATATLQCTRLQGRVLKMRHVTAKKGTYIGEASLVSAGSEVGEGTILHPGTALHQDCITAPNSVWHGSPGMPMEPEEIQKSKLVPAIRQLQQKDTNAGWCTWGFFVKMFFLEWFVGMVNIPSIVFAVGSTALFSVVFVYLPPVLVTLMLAWPVAVVAMLFTLMSMAFDRAVMGLICPTPQNTTVELGSLSHMVCLHSQARAKSFFSGIATKGFTETLAVPYVLNYVLGFNIGQGTEVDDCDYFTEKSITIGEKCMINGGGNLGFPIVSNGYLMTTQARMGNKAFTGNMQVICNGSVLESGSLLGMSTCSPPNEVVPEDTIIFGSPPAVMPPRNEPSDVDLSLTFEPAWEMKLLRGCTEVVKVTMMPTLLVATGIFCLYLGVWTILSTGLSVTASTFDGFLAVLLFQFIVSFTGAIILFGSSVALKWIIIGRYIEETIPLYSWRQFMISVGYEAERHFMNYRGMFKGTSMENVCHRLMGTKIGQNVVMLGATIHDADLGDIGDNCVLYDCVLATHLFEDRMLKMGPIKMEQGCFLAPKSVVQKNCHLGSRTTIGPSSLLMQNESTLDDSVFIGNVGFPIVVKK